MNWTLALAIWGSILSTILVLLKIKEYRKDKADVKVTVKGYYKFHPSTTVYGDKQYVIITAANKGRRPVTLKGSALLLPIRSRYLICADPDPMTARRDVVLTEGKSHNYIMLEDGLKEKYGLTTEKYVTCVWDATGKYYWSHNKLKRLLKLHRVK